MLFTPIKPMLLGMRHEAFDDDRYIFEPKWDGWRILLHKDGDRIEAFTRHGNRVTDKFPELHAAGASILARTAVLDCEGICLRDGRPIFDDFAGRGLLTDPRKIAAAAQRHPATFVAFDVLGTDRDHTSEPLTDRKARLQELIDPRAEIMPSLAVEGQGKVLFETTRAREMEGIVAKRKDSRYQLDTRSDNWLKIKHWKQTDAVILGYRTEPQVEMLVGVYDAAGKIVVRGTVKYGMTPDEKSAFLQIATQLHTSASKGVKWIEPRLCCCVQYLERTETGNLRHASFKKFLFEKQPEECRFTA